MSGVTKEETILRVRETMYVFDCVRPHPRHKTDRIIGTYHCKHPVHGDMGIFLIKECFVCKRYYIDGTKKKEGK
jgi:hypothetical protein